MQGTKDRFWFRFVHAYVCSTGFVVASSPPLSLSRNPPMLFLLGVIVVFSIDEESVRLVCASISSFLDADTNRL